MPDLARTEESDDADRDQSSRSSVERPQTQPELPDGQYHFFLPRLPAAVTSSAGLRELSCSPADSRIIINDSDAGMVPS